jgi:hypothetical protein
VRDIFSLLIALSIDCIYRNYIEKTLKEGKELMAPPTPCLAVKSVLHVNSSSNRQIQISISRF